MRQYLALENIAPNDTVMRLIGLFKGSAVAEDVFGVGHGEPLGTADDGGGQLLDSHRSMLDNEEINTNEVAVAEGILVGGEGSAVGHRLRLAADIASGGSGVGQQVTRAVKVLENKLIEVGRLGRGVALGIPDEGFGTEGTIAARYRWATRFVLSILAGCQQEHYREAIK